MIFWLLVLKLKFVSNTYRTKISKSCHSEVSKRALVDRHKMHRRGAHTVTDLMILGPKNMMPVFLFLLQSPKKLELNIVKTAFNPEKLYLFQSNKELVLTLRSNFEQENSFWFFRQFLVKLPTVRACFSARGSNPTRT